MPPKKVQPDSEELSLKDIMTELSAIKNKLDKVDTLETKLDSLKTKLDSMAEENKKLAMENGELKAQLKSQEETIEAMKVGLDAVERHQRTWSVRVFNIPLTAAEERDPVLTMNKVYDLLLHPILVGAREDGAIRNIPDCEQLLETAHVLPGRPGASKPIIVRFNKRAHKSLCFRYRKDYAPSASVNGDHDRQRQSYPFYDDLTKAAAHKLSELQADSRVQSCWSINGQLRFKLKDSDTVKKVKSVFDPIQVILS